jgi:hypothetical protein
MRVSEIGGRTRRDRARGAALRFDEAIRRAARDATSARGRIEATGREATARGSGADPDAVLPDRRGSFSEEQRVAPAPPAPRPPELTAAAAAPAELRALLRTLPLAVDARGLRDGAPLTLSFGRSLGVELRSGAGGVEVVLRADARLARACERALPALLAALRRRGVPVARAAVRSRAASAADPRVDAARPLR